MSKQGDASKRKSDVPPPASRGGGTDRTATSGETRNSKDSEARNRSPSGHVSTHEQVAVLAYELWEARGRPEGDACKDWYEARRQLQGDNPDFEPGMRHAAEFAMAGAGDLEHPVL
ncbi:MAG: hypothetical protein JWN86_1553 [Planctomycetota bacterium]|nr:hypothetical protein [Planctomycetota bacterium]